MRPSMPDQLRARTGRLPITALVRSTAQRIRQAPLTLQRQETRGGSATEYAHFLMHRRPDALAPVDGVATDAEVGGELPPGNNERAVSPTRTARRLNMASPFSGSKSEQQAVSS